MKSVIEEAERIFNPTTLTITFDSYEEAMALLDLTTLTGKQLVDQLQQKGYVINSSADDINHVSNDIKTAITKYFF